MDFKRLVLTGVDLTSWGADLPGAPRLGDLVMRILRLVPDLPQRVQRGELSTAGFAAAVSLAAAEQRRLEAANALEIARAVYNRRLGRPLDAAVHLEPLTTAPVGTATAEPLGALVSMAVAGRPELAPR